MHGIKKKGDFQEVEDPLINQTQMPLTVGLPHRLDSYNLMQLLFLHIEKYYLTPNI